MPKHLGFPVFYDMALLSNIYAILKKFRVVVLFDAVYWL